MLPVILYFIKCFYLSIDQLWTSLQVWIKITSPVFLKIIKKGDKNSCLLAVKGLGQHGRNVFLFCSELWRLPLTLYESIVQLLAKLHELHVGFHHIHLQAGICNTNTESSLTLRVWKSMNTWSYDDQACSHLRRGFLTILFTKTKFFTFLGFRLTTQSFSPTIVYLQDRGLGPTRPLQDLL